MKAEQAKREQENRKREEQNKEQTELNRLKSLIEGSPDLTVLEKNYQKVKNNPLYTDSKKDFLETKTNKGCLDEYYTRQKRFIEIAQETRKDFTTTITNSLKNCNLSNSDLSSEYRNWTEKLKKLINPQQISDSSLKEVNHLKDQLMADIQARSQEKKTAQEFTENLAKAQKANATKEEKKQVLEELEKAETTKSYSQKKSQVNSLKTELAQADPEKYRQEVITNLNHKLQTNKVSIQSLDSEKWPWITKNWGIKQWNKRT